MKKTLMYMIILIIMTISTCSLQPLTFTLQPVITPTLVRNDLTWEESLLVSQLSKSTGISPEEILVASAEAVTWPNHCLGIVHVNMLCTQGEVLGFRFVLIAHDKEYEFHTNRDMTLILLVDGK